uniref:Uncharacterized protein n=1 Tax=Steinernema glaseri TaxID=37863 RepID=A0A1I8A7V4_9BILA
MNIMSWYSPPRNLDPRGPLRSSPASSSTSKDGRRNKVFLSILLCSVDPRILPDRRRSIEFILHTPPSGGSPALVVYVLLDS